MNAKLVLIGGGAEPAEIRLRLPLVAGRGRHANLVVPHPLVSRRHCELTEVDGAVFVRDLGSMNGTYVNGQRVSEAFLQPGDSLMLGSITFRVEYEPDHAKLPTLDRSSAVFSQTADTGLDSPIGDGVNTPLSGVDPAAVDHGPDTSTEVAEDPRPAPAEPQALGQ